eukprot:TRINITY_DN20061_c0_g1_i1.p1 TRINITY_DN20061_c0_g1~~TRINITY_DN20061_c0_g1_i1.p1  ORF type:complete len:419 (-),score=61.86 TRINITY_DN20061_c0_g1_i1:79-1290(-)
MDKHQLSLVQEEAKRILPEVVAFRRVLHQEPEVGLQLPKTTKKLKDFLEGLPLEIRLSRVTTGIVGILKGKTPGKNVLLRADMDALPIVEETRVPFSSTNNLMHACGHDLHVAMLAGAVRILVSKLTNFAGTLIFMFQPGEEGYHGAKIMLEEPGLIPDNIDAAFGIHVTPKIPAGCFGSKAGPLMASSDTLSVKVVGVGGHGGLPWDAIDPIPATCSIILGLQNLVTRKFSPTTHPMVLSVTKIAGGIVNNAIPSQVNFGGTLRTFSEDSRRDMHVGMTSLCTGIAEAFGCKAEVTIHHGYPVTVNNEQITELTRQNVCEIFGEKFWLNVPLVTGSEDFSYVLQKFPGTFCFMGTPIGECSDAPSLHSSLADFNEDVMVKGMVMHCTMAWKLLYPQISHSKL